MMHALMGVGDSGGSAAVSPADRFRGMAAAACARLDAVTASDAAESAVAGAIESVSHAVGFLEALNLVAPEVARSLAPDAENLERALDCAGRRLGMQSWEAGGAAW